MAAQERGLRGNEMLKAGPALAPPPLPLPLQTTTTLPPRASPRLPAPPVLKTTSLLIGALRAPGNPTSAPRIRFSQKVEYGEFLKDDTSEGTIQPAPNLFFTERGERLHADGAHQFGGGLKRERRVQEMANLASHRLVVLEPRSADGEAQQPRRCALQDCQLAMKGKCVEVGRAYCALCGLCKPCCGGREGVYARICQKDDGAPEPRMLKYEPDVLFAEKMNLAIDFCYGKKFREKEGSCNALNFHTQAWHGLTVEYEEDDDADALRVVESRRFQGRLEPNFDSALALIQRCGVSVDFQKRPYKESVLHAAVYGGNWAVTKFLIETLKANPRVLHEYPEDLQANHRLESCKRDLLACTNAAQSSVLKDKVAAYEVIVKYLRVVNLGLEILELLAEIGSDENGSAEEERKRCEDALAEAILAVERGDFPVDFQWTDDADKTQKTLLVICCHLNDFDLAQWLVNFRDADVLLQDNHGRTALDIAAALNRKSIVEMFNTKIGRPAGAFIRSANTNTASTPVWAPIESRSVYLENLPQDIVESEVCDIFGRYGEIVSVSLYEHRRIAKGAARRRGDGHIVFLTVEAAEAVIKLSEVEYHGGMIKMRQYVPAAVRRGALSCITIAIHKSMAPCLVGTRGANLNSIVEQTKAFINIGKEPEPGCDPDIRIVTIDHASKEGAVAAHRMICQSVASLSNRRALPIAGTQSGHGSPGRGGSRNESRESSRSVANSPDAGDDPRGVSAKRKDDSDGAQLTPNFDEAKRARMPAIAAPHAACSQARVALTTERCRNFPTCRFGSKCNFLHLVAAAGGEAVSFDRATVKSTLLREFYHNLGIFELPELITFQEGSSGNSSQIWHNAAFVCPVSGTKFASVKTLSKVTFGPISREKDGLYWYYDESVARDAAYFHALSYFRRNGIPKPNISGTLLREQGPRSSHVSSSRSAWAALPSHSLDSYSVAGEASRQWSPPSASSASPTPFNSSWKDDMQDVSWSDDEGGEEKERRENWD